jgi:hypothetical protein
MQHCRTKSVRPSFPLLLLPTKWINGRGGDAAGFSGRSGCVGIFSTFDVTGRNRPKIRA